MKATMPAMSRLLCLLVITCLTGCAVNRANDLAGGWLTQPAEPGAKPNLLVFNRQGETWVGVITTSFGDMQLNNIAIKGEHVSFNQVLNLGIGPPQSMQLQGTLKDGELRLSMSSPTGLSEQVARKVSAKEVSAFEAAKPKKLPLPPLRDVPDNGLARTPPMGWNSWNKFALMIDDQTVREIAAALVSSGLRDVGFVYVNIDDGWQGERDANGVLHANAKFPDMKALADYIHSRGLKFGIYSSPGPYTCGGHAGSHGHEEQDAKMFADWGVDYLKYDWCSALGLYKTQAEMQASYQKMGEALQATGRPIVYALCQYGFFDVGKWARQVGGNVWRTTLDIRDEWQSMANNGFNQNGKEIDAGPGGWNDPDLLEVGNGGMSVDEYRTHMSLWSMLSAPLLLGNDVRDMTPEIKAFLTNKEVIAIDQDALGQQGHRVVQQGETEIWTKTLTDGATAVALFNRSEMPANIAIRWPDLGIAHAVEVRDLWRQTDLGSIPDVYPATLPPHGVLLLRVVSNQ